MNKKIGVYICHCGSNISDYVDVEKVREAAAGIDGVAVSKTTMFACSDAAQKEIIQDIQEKKLDAIVVASCSPKLHLYTFRDVAVRAGLNAYNYVQVNIREQCSWAHSDKPDDATEKAIHLVRAGTERVRYANPLESLEISSVNKIIVVGAGVAGLRAAIELADMGTYVYLIEKEPFVGGHTARWDKLYPTEENGADMIARLFKKVKDHERIELLTKARLVSTSGSVGNYQVEIEVLPDYIDDTIKHDEKAIQKAIEVCPVEVEDAFNFNLTKRKAIYRNHPGQFPGIPVIDMESCTKCKKCEQYLNKIDFDKKNKAATLNAGAILLATGFSPYEPGEGEFGYREIDRVVTLQQFKRLIALNDRELYYRNRQIRHIAFIYCVGSRQTDGDKRYCSRYCCTAAMFSALEAREKFGELYNYHLTRGMRSYGKQEIVYNDALDRGDLILEFPDDAPPQIEKAGDRISIKLNDRLSGSLDMEIIADMVVLVTGMIPGHDRNIADILKVPVGRDGFFNEIHPKLRPVETVIDGVFIAGTCQSPKNITESILSSLSAASKANNLISKGEIELEPILATVEKEICEWCGACEKVCPYDAINKISLNGKFVADVDESKCKGCGMCLPVCEVNAIQLSGYTDVEIESMIESLA